MSIRRPALDDNARQAGSGSARAQGFETSAIGHVTERLSLLANYSYTDTKLTDPSTPLIFGQPQRNVPLHQASVWGRYNLLQDACQTFGLALGLVHVGKRTANLAADVELPDYTRIDSGVFYRRGAWDTAVYLENIFDKHYAVSSINELRLYPGAPFNVRAHVGVSF